MAAPGRSGHCESRFGKLFAFFYKDKIIETNIPFLSPLYIYIYIYIYIYMFIHHKGSCYKLYRDYKKYTTQFKQTVRH